MLEWHVVSSAVYYAADASTLNDNYLYFLSDTKEIYKGAQGFTQAVEMLVAPEYALPTTPARKRIYIHPTTLEGKVYDGKAWTTVIKPVVDAVVADGTDPVNSKAVIAYVAAEIDKVAGSGDLLASLSYAKDAIKLTTTNAAGETADLLLEGIGTTLNYDKATGALELKDVSGTVLGTAVNLDLERFVSDAVYDPETKKITLSFNDSSEPLVIDVADLVDTYTAENSKSIALTVTANKFKAEAIIASTEGNMLQSTDTGLYVAATDLTNYQTLVADATANNLATLTATGQVKDGGVAVGGAAFAASPNATTLATEAAASAAIAAAIDTLTATMNTQLAAKMAKVTGATAGHVATFDDNGQVADSSKAVGGATLSASPNANTLATEAAVKAYADTAVGNAVAKSDVTTALTSGATDDQVPSAKAVYDQLTWKTTL